MAALPQIPELEIVEESRAKAENDSYVFRRFLSWVLLVSTLLYVTAVPLIRIPSYERWGTSHWGPMLEYAWTPGPESADVVIFGDSSAFLGIDPRLINGQLGIRSLVMPNTAGSLPVLGDTALEHYLDRHAAPRLIVFYFSPWDLDFKRSPSAKLYEGEEMLLRHGSWRAIARFGLRRPVELLLFPLRHYSTLGPTAVKNMLEHRDRERETEQALGHAEDRENFPPLRAPCAVPSRYAALSSDASIRELVEKYTTPQTRVLVYLAPVPGCANVETMLQRLPTGLREAPSTVLPAKSFLDDGYFAHIEPASVPLTSRLLAQTIEATLRHSPR